MVRRIRESNPDPIVNPPIRLLEFFTRKYSSDSKRKAFKWETKAVVEWLEMLRATGKPDGALLRRVMEYFTKHC